MQDLTQYSENELSMIIFNDEGLYNIRYVINEEMLKDMGFKFTEEQYQTFQDDLEDEDDEE